MNGNASELANNPAAVQEEPVINGTAQWIHMMASFQLADYARKLRIASSIAGMTVEKLAAMLDIPEKNLNSTLRGEPDTGFSLHDAFRLGLMFQVPLPSINICKTEETSMWIGVPVDVLIDGEYVRTRITGVTRTADSVKKPEEFLLLASRLGMDGFLMQNCPEPAIVLRPSDIRRGISDHECHLFHCDDPLSYSVILSEPADIALHNSCRSCRRQP